MNYTTQKGYAKINLHLDVTGIIQNGFHSVCTVMQSLSLCDDVTLTLRNDSTHTVSCNIENVPTGRNNIAIRAADAFCETSGVKLGVDIHIEKHIPMAAGLAGGSADAAAVLKGMNELFGNPLSMDVLCRIGGRLGSDIPFCIMGGTRLADGKGDLLHPFPSMPDCTVIVACGGEGVSTPWAYGLLDDIHNKFSDYTPHSVDALLTAMQSGSINGIANSIFNIFEAPILERRPVARQLKQIMLDRDALGAMMSGSGPSVFGIFTDSRAVDLTCEGIRALGVTPHVCKPIR